MRSRSKVTSLVLALLGATVLGKTGDVLRTHPSAASAPSTYAASRAPSAPVPAADTALAAATRETARETARATATSGETGSGRTRAARAGTRDGASGRDRPGGGARVSARRAPAGRARPRVQPMPTLVIGAPAERTSEW